MMYFKLTHRVAYTVFAFIYKSAVQKQEGDEEKAGRDNGPLLDLDVEDTDGIVDSPNI